MSIEAFGSCLNALSTFNNAVLALVGRFFCIQVVLSFVVKNNPRYYIEIIVAYEPFFHAKRGARRYEKLLF